MAKKFKLVYEDAGQLKGSYTGVPTEEDIALIDKAVLDGEEEPKPIEPTGTIEINENGTVNVADYATAEVNVAIPEEYIIPEGTKEIRANGEYNIREFENVNIDIPGATTKELFEATENGTYDIAEYANVKVDVPNPSSGVLEITANGEYDVSLKASVDVDVPIPPEYVIPEGKIEITENGNNINVAGKAAVDVNVPVGVFPEGSLDITENGNNIDVTNKATINVNVPNPSTGILNITENGEYDVTAKAGVNVDVPVPAGYIIPEGTLELYDIYEDGTHDVHNYDQVEIALDSQRITENYLHSDDDLISNTYLVDLDNFEGDGLYQVAGAGSKIFGWSCLGLSLADDAVIPEGSLDITENGTDIDVAEYATVNVNVQPDEEAIYQTVVDCFGGPDDSYIVSADEYDEDYYGLYSVSMGGSCGINGEWSQLNLVKEQFNEGWYHCDEYGELQEESFGQGSWYFYDSTGNFTGVPEYESDWGLYSCGSSSYMHQLDQDKIAFGNNIYNELVNLEIDESRQVQDQNGNWYLLRRIPDPE